MDRDKIAALGLTVNQVETAMFNAYGTRQVSQIYAPNNQYQVHPGRRAGVPARSVGALAALRPLVERPPHRAQLVATATTAGRTADGQPHRPAAVGDDLVQPQAGRRARRRGRRRFSRSPADTLPSTVSTSFQGTAQAFQDSLQGLGLILVMADRRHLHRAGRPVRELHAPADDSVGPAVGRLRRAADAADLQDRAEPLRVRRRHHARRPREEERHHDGGLRRRPRSASTARSRSRRSTRPVSCASARS